MFAASSRYYRVPTYEVETQDGRRVQVVIFPVRPAPPTLGFHRRQEAQRLDLIAAYYLKDPTLYWRICDANAPASPHAVAVREFIAISVPGK